MDTNKVIAALIKDGVTRDIILNSKDTLLFPEFALREIFRYFEDVLNRTGLPDYELFSLLVQLLTKVTIIKTDQIIDYKKEADKIIGNIDPDDVIFIATALMFDCPIWSDDNHFKQQNKILIITTKEMIERLEKT